MSYLTEKTVRNTVREHLDILSKKIANRLKTHALKPGKYLAASTIQEVRVPSSKIFPTQQMAPKKSREMFPEIKVRRADALIILEKDKKYFKFVRVKDDLALAINDIIEKDFTSENFNKILPRTEDGLLFLDRIIRAVEKFVWLRIPKKFKEEEKPYNLAKSREQQVGAKTQESLLMEPIEYIAKKVLNLKDFKIIKHPHGSDKFPDFEIVDAINPQTKLVYIDSKGKAPKGTEITNSKLIKKLINEFPVIKKMLSVEIPGESKILSEREIRELLRAYNVDIEKVKTLYFLIDRRKKTSSIREARISYSDYSNFRVFRSDRGKTNRAFFIQGKKGNKWKTIFRVEFRAGDVPTLQEWYEDTLKGLLKDVQIKHRNNH